MPRQFSSALMFVSVIAIALAANRAEENSVDTVRRGPSSVMYSGTLKERTLGNFKVASNVHHTEKLRGPLKVTIERVGERNPVVGEIYAVRGVFASSEDLAHVTYKWSIPEGVELVQGTTAGEVAVSGTENTVIEISLRKQSADNLQLHLVATAHREGNVFADSAQYNTEVQSLLNSPRGPTVENVHQLKVFH